jgi:hypothetical protein
MSLAARAVSVTPGRHVQSVALLPGPTRLLIDENRYVGRQYSAPTDLL